MGAVSTFRNSASKLKRTWLSFVSPQEIQPTSTNSTEDTTTAIEHEASKPVPVDEDLTAISLEPLIRNSTDPTIIYVDAYDGNSPYAEVRASVPNYDDESMPHNTIRMWVIGLVLMSAATAMNTIFFIHDPPFKISPYLIIMLAWPFAWIWERVVPNIWGLNPGSFTYKEHASVSILAAASSMSLTSDAVISLTYFYRPGPLGSDISFVTLLNWGVSLSGMAIAGAFTKALVDPPSMIWPSQLVTVTLLSNIHVKWNHVANGWRITRNKFFCFAAAACFGYSFVIHLFARFLSHFSFGCWISPKNYVVNQLFGTITGAGLFPITFDWNVVTGSLPSPLVPPAHVFVNVATALFALVWVVSTGLHYSNVWWGRHLPFSEAQIYDRYGHGYDINRIVEGGMRIDQAKYESYSPAFMAITRLMSFGMQLAGSTSLLVHTLLFDSRRIISYFKKPPEDIHAILMRKYNPVPKYWYALLFIVGVSIIYASVFGYDTGVTGWYPVVALGLVILFFLPTAFLTATTTISVSLSALSLLIAGYMDPGEATSMVVFMNWTVSALDAGIQHVAMMKLAHYTKIRPKFVFIVRLVGLLWSGVLQSIILVRVKPVIANECQVSQDTGFTCAQARTFYTEAILWGVIGSKKMMLLYRQILHFLWIGALLPILTWLYLKKWPRSKLRLLNWPIFFNALEMVPPASPYNYTCWAFVGIIFSHWIRRYWHSWWAKYCYTLSAALDFGIAAMELLLFFIYIGSKYTGPVWWGNYGYRENLDGQSIPLVPLKPGEFFGPTKW